MTGHIRSRGENSWELKFDLGRDPATGKRASRYHSFKGTKREAQRKLAELIAAASSGSYIEPSKMTVADFVRARVDQWEAAGNISARAAQRYRQLVENQIVPHLGAKALQKVSSRCRRMAHDTTQRRTRGPHHWPCPPRARRSASRRRA
jgi:integrase